MTSGESRPGGSGFRWVRLLAPVLAVAAIAAGIAALQAPRRNAGWFAYAPLSNQAFLPSDAVLIDGPARAGFLLVAAGVLTLAFWLGYLAGVRRGNRPDVGSTAGTAT